MAHRLPLPNAYKVAESVAYALMRLPEKQREAFLTERNRSHYEHALQLTGDPLIASHWAKSVHIQTLAVADVLAATRRLEETTRKLVSSPQAEIPAARRFQ